VGADVLDCAPAGAEQGDGQQCSDPRRYGRDVQDRLVEARGPRMRAACVAVGEVPRHAAAVADTERVVGPGIDHPAHERAPATAGELVVLLG
jgi:hypothetical protein